MSSLSTTLKTVRAAIDKLRHKKPDEENTKSVLINPVLCALGWHVGNPDEVWLEFPADKGKVDYALFLEGATHPKLLVEAKALDVSLEGFGMKIMGYVGVVGVNWIVLTNGDEYRIYYAGKALPFKERLFRKVCITEPESPTNKTQETLGLLSKQGVLKIEDVWKGEADSREAEYADRQVRAALEQLSSQQLCDWLAPWVKRSKRDLKRKSIRASLSRLCPHLTFSKDPNPDGGNGDGGYVEFWQPIRDQPDGLFAGKPCRQNRVFVKYRPGISVDLVVKDHACRVELWLSTVDKKERRENVMKLLPADLKAGCKCKDNPKSLLVRFPVLDKGLKDRGDWPEIQNKLKSLGEEIYKRLEESDV